MSKVKIKIRFSFNKISVIDCDHIQILLLSSYYSNNHHPDHFNDLLIKKSKYSDQEKNRVNIIIVLVRASIIKNYWKNIYPNNRKNSFFKLKIF